MLELSATQPVAWSPPWLPEGVAQRRYLFRPGSVMDRARIEADLSGECRAGQVYGFQLQAAFAEGVKALLADSPDYAAQLIELASAEAALDPGERLPPEEEAALSQARETLTESWPAFRALIAQEERRNQFAPIIAFRRLCVGWEEGAPAPVGEGDEAQEQRPPVLPPFARGVDGMVTLDAMDQVPSLELRAGGLFAFSNLYGGPQAKNSAAPSQSDRGRPTSNSDKPQRAGRSAGRSGKKTPSSPPRTGRSRPSTSGSTAGA